MIALFAVEKKLLNLWSQTPCIMIARHKCKWDLTALLEGKIFSEQQHFTARSFFFNFPFGWVSISLLRTAKIIPSRFKAALPVWEIMKVTLISSNHLWRSIGICPLSTINPSSPVSVSQRHPANHKPSWSLVPWNAFASVMGSDLP